MIEEHVFRYDFFLIDLKWKFFNKKDNIYHF